MDSISNLFDIIIRSCVSIVVLFILTRLMGKRQISQLNFFDYIVGITIGSIASKLSVEKNISFIDAIVSLSIWASFGIGFSFLSLKSYKISKLLNGKPAIIIQNGILMEKEMRKSMVTIDDTMEELRLNGIFDIADVDYAILEKRGRMSVLLKTQKQPTTLGDIGASTPPKGLTANLILDGKLQTENLKLMQIDEIWLQGQLKNQGIKSYSEVLFACANMSKQLYVIPRNQEIKPYNVI